MDLTKELIEKAKKCESEQELLALAKENDIELTEEQAVGLIAKFKKTGEVADEELDNVAGGGCDAFKDRCINCKSINIVSSPRDGDMYHLVCKKCGFQWNLDARYYYIPKSLIQN